MSIDPLVRDHIDAGRFDEVESAWLERVAAARSDLDFFVPVLRTLVRRGEEARATVLVQLLLEAHVEVGDHHAALQLLRRTLQFWPTPPLRAALCDNIRARHATRPSLDRLLEQFDPKAASDPLHTMQMLESWLAYDVGSWVWMETRGLGRVLDLNLGLSSLRVDFAGKTESFKLGEAERLLQPLEPGHFLREKAERPAELQAIAAEDPGEILRRVFTSLQRPLTTQELRTYLAGVVDEAQWNSWWKRARADRRLTAGPGSRPTLHWSDSAAAAEATLAEGFAAAPLRDKINLARQHLGRSDALAPMLLHGLQQAASEAVPEQPELALEATLLLADNDIAHPALDTLLADHRAPGWIAGFADRRAREAALARLLDHSPRWTQIFAEMLLVESDARTLAYLYDTLRQFGGEGVLDATLQAVLAKPARSPRLFLWLCRECGKRDELRRRADWTLLRRIFDALSDQACRSVRAGLREAFDLGGIGLDIAANLEPPQAEQLLRMLDRDGLEEHRRQALREVVWRRFPDLEPNEKEEPLYVTAASFESKRAEFEKLVREEIPRNTEEIRKAAAHGDLRENFEYKSARERQEMLSSRAKTLHDELRRARPLDPGRIDTSEIRVGTRVALQATNGSAPRTLTILGPWDSDPERDVYSYLAPAIAKLLGKRAGDTVEFAGAVYRVQRIEAWT